MVQFTSALSQFISIHNDKKFVDGWFEKRRYVILSRFLKKFLDMLYKLFFINSKCFKVRCLQKSYKCIVCVVLEVSTMFKLKFRENLPNSQKFRGPAQSGRSQGSQR